MAMTQEDVMKQLHSRVSQVLENTPTYTGDLLRQSAQAYKQRWGTSMPETKMAILANSFTNLEAKLLSKGVDRNAIVSAVSDLSKTDNPLVMLYSLLSIIIPNFAYSEVIGIQPMPTKKSPVYFPQITAMDTRNGVTKGDVLLGSTNWMKKNTYTTNKAVVDAQSAVTTTALNFTATEANIIPGSAYITFYKDGTGTFNLFDDGKGKILNGSSGVLTGDATINYATGNITGTLAAAMGASDTITITYRYDFSAGTLPSQINLTWVDEVINAEPYRLRSTYDIENFYQAKKVLSGYDIDAVMNTTLAGYINKEISGNVFDDMLVRADATYTFNATEPTGVAWALHRLKLLQVCIQAGNGIRENIGRGGGNIIVAGTDFMNIVETFGEDLWKPQKYSAEPIGPYVAGTLGDRFKVLKNQDFPASTAIMSYKRDETDASVVGGSFISLYSTPPIAKDDLTVTQGMGTVMGYKKIIDNSIVQIDITK